MKPTDFLVRVNCMTYNHASYIVDALNGFTMQQTTFPFVCTIVDDASTDGEPEIIKEYLEEHFDLEEKSIVRNEETDDYHLTFARHKTNHNCYFAVFYLKYNHYSIKKSKMPYLKDWANTKYIALCEGDDYWTDTQKIQLQVVYMNLHSTCSMCWHNANILDMSTGKICGNHRRYKRDSTCSTEDMIIHGGGFCPTASIVYRTDIRSQAPERLFNQHIGDYPLQLYMAFNGDVWYIDRPMSIYRINVPGSWTTSVANNIDVNERKKIWMETMKLYNDFNEYSNYQYNESFNQRRLVYLFYEYFAIGDYSSARKYWYQCKMSTRPWSMGLILNIHGLGTLVKYLKKLF